MFEVAMWGLLAAIVLLSFSETAVEGWVVPRWRRRGGPNRLEDWQARHATVVAVGILVVTAVYTWSVGSAWLWVMAVVSLGQLRSQVRVHRRWHAGEFAANELAR